MKGSFNAPFFFGINMKAIYLMIFLTIGNAFAVNLDSKGNYLPSGSVGNRCQAIYSLLQKDTVPLILINTIHRDNKKLLGKDLRLCKNCSKEKLEQFYTYRQRGEGTFHPVWPTKDNISLDPVRNSFLKERERRICFNNTQNGSGKYAFRLLFKDNECIKRELFEYYMQDIVKATNSEINEMISLKDKPFLEFFQACYKSYEKTESIGLIGKIMDSFEEVKFSENQFISTLEVENPEIFNSQRKQKDLSLSEETNNNTNVTGSLKE